MNPVLERAVKAAAETLASDCPFADNVARAVLGAVRDPSDDMLHAGGNGRNLAWAWKRMIDEVMR